MEEEDEDVLEKEDVGEDELESEKSEGTANVEEAVRKNGQKSKEKMEEKRVSPKTTKRIRKVGQIFKSPFLNLLCLNDSYVDDIQEATAGIRLAKLIETIEYWLIDSKMKSVQGYQLFDALKTLRMRYTYEVIVDDLNKYKEDVSVKARKYYNAISKN
uniref:Uncharacterized protein n=1 Tax=Chenopodium quinoa TaxID=63459 RepID=A0A803N1Z1_CHEQI